METRLVNPNDCRCIQSRVLLDPATVQEYADMMDKGVAFDPCKGIITATGAILVYDGNHRVESAKVNGSMIEVELMRGTEQDAAWLALAANTRHGLKRSANDIVKVVKDALRHPNALGKSDREIARHCGCDHKTVGKYRKELEASGERPQITTRTVQRNGQEYQMTIPEPEPASEYVYQVRDGQHVKVGVEQAVCIDCGASFQCAGQKTVLMKSWKTGIAMQYDLRCLDCGERWSDYVSWRRAGIEAERAKLQAAHEKHGLLTDTAVPMKDNPECPMCGTTIHGNEEHYMGLTLHAGCYNQLIHPEECFAYTRDAMLEVQKTLRADVPFAFRKNALDVVKAIGRQAFDLLEWPTEPESMYVNIHSGSRMLFKQFTAQEYTAIIEYWQPVTMPDAPARPDNEVCDFCGEDFPPAKVYASAGNLPNCFHICRSCASKALHALQPPEALPEPTYQEGSSPSGLPTIAFREYDPENESKPNTEEWWFARSEMTAWDHFQVYQYYRMKSGEEKSQIYKLDADVRALKLEIENLKKARDFAIDAYEKLRDKKEHCHD